jgi:DNA-binding NarL/FixJ family response regulator
MIGVFLAEDHLLVREGIRNSISLSKDMKVVGETSDGWQAVNLIRDLSPDVAVLDLMMPGLTGDEVVRMVKDVPTKCIILTSVEDPRILLSASSCGACGLLSKSIDSASLLSAIRSAFKGEEFTDPKATVLLSKGLDEEKAKQKILCALSSREKEVLLLVGKGRSNKEIAYELSISENTVKVHVSSIFAKIGLQDRVQVALFAQRNGL